MLIYDPKEHPYTPSLDHPLSPRGRFSRLAYLAWYMVLTLIIMVPVLIGVIAFTVLGQSLANQDMLLMVGIGLMLILYLIFFYYAFVITIRRLHDLNQTGWLSLLMFVPLINIGFMLYVMLAKGTPLNNEFGAPRPNRSWEAVLGKIYIVLSIIGLFAGALAFTAGFSSYQGQSNSQQIHAY